MKKSLFVMLLSLLASVCIFAQGKNIVLNFNHLLDGQQYSKMKGVNSPENTFIFGSETISYFVSKIKIVHDEGKISEAKGVYLLVNPDSSNLYSLGTMIGVDKVEAVEFGLGVDQETNHLDPTTYPAGHPLSLQNPSTHWSWTAGYRFIVFEGMAGVNVADMTNSFAIHSLGDALYKTVNIPASGTVENDNITILVNAEYRFLMSGIDASRGVESKGGTGDAKKLMENLKKVFLGKLSAVNELENEALNIYPNPAFDQLTVKIKNQGNENQSVLIFDVAGKEVFNSPKQAEVVSYPLNISAGIYHVVVKQNNKIVNQQKIVIQK